MGRSAPRDDDSFFWISIFGFLTFLFISTLSIAHCLAILAVALAISLFSLADYLYRRPTEGMFLSWAIDEWSNKALWNC